MKKVIYIILSILFLLVIFICIDKPIKIGGRTSFTLDKKKVTNKKTAPSEHIIILKDFELVNVVAYKLNRTTIVVSQEEFKKQLVEILEIYREGIKDFSDEDKEFKDAYTSRFKVLDSTLKLFAKKTNIIYLDDKYFARHELRSPMDFEKKIEDGECAILDHFNKRIFKIKRKSFKWYNNPEDAGSGIRYYLLGEKDFFYETIEWIA